MHRPIVVLFEQDRADEPDGWPNCVTELTLKWVFLAILLVSIGPASAWLRKRPDSVTWACFLIGLLPFISGWFHFLAAPISWDWVGYTKGLEIWVIDFVAVVIVIFLRGKFKKPPFIIPMALYFISVLIATFHADIPEAAVFYCWQLLRIFMVYFTVVNICALEFEATSAILKGLAAGELLECAFAIWERFRLHILQTPGTLGSQNELGIATHFVVFPFFAIMLGGRRGWLPAVVVLASLMTYALTTSRASVLLGVVGLGLVWLLSSLAQFSGRKLAVVTIGLIALALMAPLAITSFDKRFAGGRSLGLAEDSERLAFKRAAWMMLADHPEGVGPNNFVEVANVGGYYNRSGGVSRLGRSTNVHNLYLLVLAETGPLGLASFILMLAAPLVMALRYGPFGRWQAGDPQRDILIGASVTLMIVYIHSTEEWVPIVAELQYLLAIMFGLIAGLTAEERAAKRMRDRLPASSQNLLRGGSP